MNGASKALYRLIEKLENQYDIYVLIRGEGTFSEALKKRKCTVIIKYYDLDAEPYSNDNLFSRLKWIIRVGRYVLYRNIRNNIVALNIAKYVQSKKIDIIHSNSSCISIGTKIAKKTGTYHIWHFREFLFEDFHLMPLFGFNYLIRLARNSKMNIFVSDCVLRKYQSVLEKNSVRIYDGTEYSVLCNHHKEHDGFNIMQVISKGKGTDIVIHALKELKKRGYDNVHLYLAGRGDLSTLDIDISDLEENIHLLGFVNNLSEFRCDSNIDVEVVCSVAEAFGLVTIEAMAAGNPVIGSDTGGTKEIINDGVTGLLFKQGDFIALANKLQYLIENRREIIVLGKNAYEDVRNRFSEEACIEAIRNIYEDCVNNE